jgi:uncharacterized damage-inducible protein DinB
MQSQKDVLLDYLQTVREAVVWKLDGVSDYDARRPLTPTGTNLLGLVKHLAHVELGYFVGSFGREVPVPSPFDDPDADPHDDLVARADESRDDVLALYRLAWREAAATFADRDLDAEAVVPWWPPERNPVTLGRLLVHVIAETNRHAGQIDILRETVDGAVGLRAGVSNLPDDDYDWEAHLARVQGIADGFR